MHFATALPETVGRILRSARILPLLAGRLLDGTADTVDRQAAGLVLDAFKSRPHRVESWDWCVPGFERLRSPEEWILVASLDGRTTHRQMIAEWLDDAATVDRGDSFVHPADRLAILAWGYATFAPAGLLDSPVDSSLPVLDPDDEDEDETGGSDVTAYLYLRDVTDDGDGRPAPVDLDGRPARRVDSLLAGDRLDLAGDPIADPEGEEPEHEFEYATVESVDRESDECIRVDFVNGRSVGFPPDHLVAVDPDQSPEPAIMPAAAAWAFAADWGSYLRSGDPGAVMYGFNERFRMRSEDHRTAVLRYVASDILRPIMTDRPAELHRLLAFVRAVVVADVDSAHVAA